jgi:hypothetical protein
MQEARLSQDLGQEEEFASGKRVHVFSSERLDWVHF